MNFEEPDGATPLDPDEAAGLRLTHITARGELNRWEQENIAAGEAWAFGRRRGDLFDEGFIRRLHQKMFGEVWRWAGEFRRSGKNIGVDRLQIPVELRNLCDDVRAWLELDTYPADEIAARFHHRLVSIHLFANGNGRHARTLTDLLLVQRLAAAPLYLGKGNLTDPGAVRQLYIEALADRRSRRLRAAAGLCPILRGGEPMSEPILPPLKPIPIKDRLSVLFLERGHLDVLDGAFVVVDKNGVRTHIPVGGVACLMLEPGTRVSHAAVTLASRVGCLLVWVGEAGVRLYASGQPGGARADRLLYQAKLALDDGARLRVVRKMYDMLARQYMVDWRNRNYECSPLRRG